MNKSLLQTPAIFDDFPEVVAGYTLRAVNGTPLQDQNFGFRALEGVLPTTDYAAFRQAVIARRQALAQQVLGTGAKAGFAHQTHNHIVIEAKNDLEGSTEADGLVTAEANLLIGVFVADCAAILLYDPKAKVISAAHSGWRGTKANIVQQAIARMETQGAHAGRIRAYISPVACPKHYEVGPSFREFFAEQFLPVIDGRVCFDNQAALQVQLQAAGVTHIQIDATCTVETPQLHSYRRDGQRAGRTLVFIGLRS